MMDDELTIQPGGGGEPTNPPPSLRTKTGVISLETAPQNQNRILTLENKDYHDWYQCPQLRAHTRSDPSVPLNA